MFLSSLCLASITFADSPPRYVPDALYNQFTMDGNIPVLDWYFNNTVPEGHYHFYSKQLIDEYTSKILKREPGYYGQTDIWLYEALDKYPIANKDVGIIGSTLPFYECVVLAYGGNPITVEYNRIVSEDPRIISMTASEFSCNPRKFDVILSISSIEHDGLGRYGDPINPNSDLEFMTTARALLKEGGHMILAVPVGHDALVWNAHRKYGKCRLPLLLKEWNLIDSFGFSEDDFKEEVSKSGGHQPIFYLSPK